MSVQLHFNNFTSGELTPLLHARVDFANYNKGARKIRNSLITPQGGLTNRFGTRWRVRLDQTDSSQVKVGVLNYNDQLRYSLVFENNKIVIHLGSIPKATVVTAYTGTQVPEIQFDQDSNKLLIVHPDHKPRLLERNATDDTIWTITDITFKNEPVYDFARDYDNISFKPQAVSGSDIKLTSSADFWEARHVGGTFAGNKGLVRIISWVSRTEVKVNVLDDFGGTGWIAGKDSFIGEPVFSDLRGWPGALGFYQGRVWFSGPRSLPAGIFGSAVFDAFNFDDTGATPSDAISNILSGNGFNKIKYIAETKDLFVLTSNAEYTTPPFTDQPASPANTYFPRQSKHGVADVKPVELDDKIIAIDKGGKIVRAFQYNVQKAKYDLFDISVLSPHLIKDPVDAATFENPEGNNGSYMLLINGDGTLSVFILMEQEAINGWTQADTDGKFKQVVSTGSYVLFLVERTVNEGSTPATYLYLEELSFDFFNDSAIEFTFGSPVTTVSGLSHLDGKNIQIIGDGYLRPNKIVHNGEVTLDEPATNFKAGLEVDWEIVPMTAQFETKVAGNNLYKKKRLKTVYLDYYNSLGIKVNGYEIPELKFGISNFDELPVPKTGVANITNMGGWQTDEVNTVSGNQPLPFTILSISYGVDS